MIAALRLWSLLGAILIPGLAAADGGPAAERAAAPPLVTQTADGFPVPVPGTPLLAPAVHGAHPHFRIEWWYITGHLFGTGGRRFGFQATFFRHAHPDAQRAARSAAAPPETFGQDQIHLAHLALTDVETGRFLHQERLGRDGWDARAAVGQLDVVHGNWFLRAFDDPAVPGGLAFALGGTLHAEAKLDLRLRPAKPFVLFGDRGVSRKGADPTAASYYITFTRLQVEGQIELDGRPLAVTGTAWFDHEISSSQLGPDQVGWDWVSIQLDDGRELMAYLLRRRDGSIDPFSTLAWISARGAVTQFGPEHFRWEPLEFWTSPKTGARYPISVRLTVPEGDGPPLALTLRPFVRDQELSGAVGGIPYWEGACAVVDGQGRPVGSAYLELTGYAGDLSDRL